MAWFKTGSFYPPITIIGKDLDAGATLNADIGPNLGLIPAGRLMSYNATSKLLIPWDATADAPGATVAGVLAMGVDSTDAVNPAVGMVYRRGTFLRQELEAANQVLIPMGGPLDIALNGAGIFLEYSWEMYTDMETPPPAAPTTLP